MELGNLGNLLGGLDGDKIAEVVNLVIANRAAIEQLAKLPEFIGGLAGHLDGAGEQAVTAAHALVGDDGASGARGALASASTALAGIASTLGDGVARIADTAESASHVPLMGGAAGHLADAAQQMGESTSQLSALAASMGQIADVLDEVANALANVGQHLRDTGSQARGFLATS